MQKLILDKEHIRELVAGNAYIPDPKTRFISRCIDGRYPNDKGLPALAVPGADIGELALLLATANAFGFEIQEKAAFQALVDTVSGEENIRMHTDSHATSSEVASGCGHMRQISHTPSDYHLTEKQVASIKSMFEAAKKQKAHEVVLHGEHKEGAVVIVRGQYGLYPHYIFETEEGIQEGEMFIYHQTLADERHRVLAKKLIKGDIITLHDGCDEDYLYQVISHEAEEHLMTTAKRLAVGLPLYHVVFDTKGQGEVKEMGKI